MKKLRSVSLVGITLIALAHAGWAAGHGGGGGGFHGGGGFGGGGHFGGGGAARGGGVGFGGGNRGGGFHFGGARSTVPAGHFSAIRPGHSFPASGIRPSAIRSGPHVVARPNRGTMDRSDLNRPVPSNIAGNRGAMPQVARPSRTLPQRGLNGRTDHIFARHDGNWHGDWDRRHAHFHNGRFFVFNDGFWFGLDNGYFPWDYMPYYAYDYYPYDYYPGGVQPSDSSAPVYNGAPVADATVQAAQTRLTQLGYYGGPADGIFGPATRDAVARYQIAKQLNVTGSLSPDTLQSLQLPQGTSS